MSLDAIVQNAVRELIDVTFDEDSSSLSKKAARDTATDVLIAVAHDNQAVHPATFVRFIETMLDLGDDTAAKTVLELYLLKDVHQDQYFIRALCAKSILQHRHATHLHGAEALKARQEAMTTVLHALNLAETQFRAVSTSPEDAHASALVYNASVHHWTVVRPLMRTGRKRLVLPSMRKVADALLLCKEPDTRWLIHNVVALIGCLVETRDFTTASDYISRCLEAFASLKATDDKDAQTRESLERIKAHCATLADVSGGLPGAVSPDATRAPSKPQAGTKQTQAGLTGPAESGGDDLRLRVWALLQPILSRGQSASSAEDGPGHKAHVSSEVLKQRLEDVLKLMRPDLALMYAQRTLELDSGVLEFATPVMPPPTPAAGVGSGKGERTSPRAADAASNALSKTVPRTAANSDLLGYLALAAVQCGVADIAAVCLRGIRLDKTAGLASSVLATVVAAQLSIIAYSTEDAHVDVGHMVEAGPDLVQALTLAADASAAGSNESLLASNRRVSYAWAMQSSFVPRRTTLGSVVMLPQGLGYLSTDLPSLSIAGIRALLIARRIAALRTIKTGLVAAEALDDSFTIELTCTAAWNTALPLLEAGMKYRNALQPVLEHACKALEAIDSNALLLRSVSHVLWVNMCM